MGKITHFFFDVDMRCNHLGLVDFLKKHKIKVNDSEFIVFMNSKRNMVKMFCKGKSCLIHYRSESRILDPGIVKYLPKYVNGSELDMDGAIAEHLTDMLKRRQKRNEMPAKVRQELERVPQIRVRKNPVNLLQKYGIRTNTASVAHSTLIA